MSSIKGKSLCFSGKLTTLTRAKASDHAKKKGASVTSSLTGTTDILVVGPTGGGSKEQEAKNKGIEIWTEEEFNEAISSSQKGGKAKKGGAKGKKKPKEEPTIKKTKTKTAAKKKEVTTIEGKTLCFAGKLETLTRAQASKHAKENGASVTSSLTGKTDTIVVGPTGGGLKEQEAKNKGIEVWTEEEFNEAISSSKKGGAAKKGGAKGKKKSEDEPPPKKTKATAKKKEVTTIEGKTLCFTGKLETLTRAQASKHAKENGASVTSSLTGKTDILVIGPSGGGSKEQEAKNKGIETWTEEKFIAVIDGFPEKEGAATKGKNKAKDPPKDEPPAKKAKIVTKKESTPSKEKVATSSKTAPPPSTGEHQRRVMRAVLDSDPYVVYQDYDVKLMLSDSLNANSNKFYKIQLLNMKSNSNHFFVAKNWGRLGEPGNSLLMGPLEGEEKGIAEFSKTFKSKTKNTWGNEPFVRHDGKYQLVKTTGEDAGDEDGDAALGRLSEEQINKGQEILQKLRSALECKNKKKKSEAVLGSLSNEFYSLIPTKSGRQKPPRLDNLDIITEKEGLLEFWLRMGFEDVTGGDDSGSPINGVPDLPLPKSLDAAASNITDKGSINSSLSRAKTLMSAGAGNPIKHTTPNLYGAILLYTGNSIYREINRCLRLDWDKARQYWKYLRLYFEATTCFPTQPKTLWRGIAADLYEEYKVGKVITWWSISSCTSSKAVAEGFMNQLGGSDATLMTLHTKTACDISGLSFYPHEQESLLHPGTKLKVLSRKRKGKVVEIEVEEVIDDDANMKG